MTYRGSRDIAVIIFNLDTSTWSTSHTGLFSDRKEPRYPLDRTLLNLVVPPLALQTKFHTHIK